jgi:hypothetical protein
MDDTNKLKPSRMLIPIISGIHHRVLIDRVLRTIFHELTLLREVLPIEGSLDVLSCCPMHSVGH